MSPRQIPRRYLGGEFLKLCFGSFVLFPWIIISPAYSGGSRTFGRGIVGQWPTERQNSWNRKKFGPQRIVRALPKLAIGFRPPFVQSLKVLPGKWNNENYQKNQIMIIPSINVFYEEVSTKTIEISQSAHILKGITIWWSIIGFFPNTQNWQYWY